MARKKAALVRVDGKAVARLDRATREIKELKLEIKRSFYKLGKRLAEVRDDELYRARGFRTFEDYLERAVDFDRTTAYKFIRIATTFNERIALQVGADKLAASLRYIDATPAKETPGDIPRLTIDVETDDGKTRKPLTGATLREIERATRAVAAKRRARAEKRAPGAEAADRFVERANEALDRANLERVHVDVELSGRTQLVTVERVKLENAWRTFAILAKAARSI